MLEDVFVAPGIRIEHLSNPWTLDEKIEILEARVRGYQLDVAESLIPNEVAGFAILYILTSYFEMIAKLESGHTGQGQAGANFKKGFESVFPNTPSTDCHDAKTIIWEDLRCGLFHMGQAKSRVILMHKLSGPSMTIDRTGGRLFLLIDPKMFVGDLRKHFENYIARLKDTSQRELRNNFERCFDDHHAS